MTYDSALDYAIEHIPMNEYDNFDDWYDALEEKFSTPELTDSDTFGHDALEEWQSVMGDRDEPIEEPEELPTRKEEITIDRGYVVTSMGARPVEVVTSEIPKEAPKQVIIESTGSTGRTTRTNFINRLKESRFSIGNFFRRIFRRKG